MAVPKRSAAGIKGRETSHDGGYSWVVLAASFMMCVHYSFSLSHFGIFLVEYIEYFNVKKSTLIWIGALLLFVGFALANVSAVLIRKLGFRVFGIGCGLLACVSLVITAVAPNVAVIYLGTGVGASLSLVNMYFLGVLASQSYFDKRRSLASGVVTSGISAGVFIWPFLCRLLIDEYGWRGAMAILGGVQLQTLVYSALLRPMKAVTPKQEDIKLQVIQDTREEVKYLERHVDGNTSDTSDKHVHQLTTQNRKKPNIIKGLCSKTIHELFGGLGQYKNKLFFCLFATVIIQSGFITYYIMSPYRAATLGIDKSKAGILLSLYGGGSGALRILIGLLADRPWANLYVLMAAAGLCSGTLAMVSYVFTNFTQMVIFALLYSIPSATYMALSTPILRDIVGLQNLSRALGLLLMCVGLDHLFTIVLAGAIVDVTENPGVNFLLFGAFQIIGGIVFIALYTWKRKRTQRKHSHITYIDS